MFYIPHGIALDLVSDHQRELRRDAARWRLVRSRRLRPAAVEVPPAPATALAAARLAEAGDRQTPAAA